MYILKFETNGLDCLESVPLESLRFYIYIYIYIFLWRGKKLLSKHVSLKSKWDRALSNLSEVLSTTLWRWRLFTVDVLIITLEGHWKRSTEALSIFGIYFEHNVSLLTYTITRCKENNCTSAQHLNKLSWTVHFR